MSQENLGGLLYLYNGSGQPEIWSVNSMEQALQYAANFPDNRLEVPGHPAMVLPGKPKPEFVETKADHYDWRRIRNHQQAGVPHENHHMSPAIVTSDEFPF